jgi:two-component system cell cycle sensor histidine kinase/response regulator CckA
LLAFSRKQVLRPSVLSVNAAVANLIKMLDRLITSNIRIVTRCERDLWHAKVDPGQLDQVILNLSLNARDAMPLGGELMIETANCCFDSEPSGGHPEVPPGDYVMLAVSDTGSGMDLETRSHLFEPFFTTKSQGQGTGLGLSTVYGIVRQSDGFISVSSELGRGTSFKIYFPRAMEAIETVRSRDDGEPLPVGSETVLLVEDDESVREMAAVALARQGYKVLEAASGEEALAVAEEYSGEVHLLLTDVMMPKMNGHDLAERLRREHPAVKVLLCSGYTSDTVMQQGVLDASTPFLPKPFTPRALGTKVRQTLDGEVRASSPEGLRRRAERSEGDDPAQRYTA